MIKNQIGKGPSNNVYKVIDLLTNQYFAVKCYPHNGYEEDIKNEI